METDFAEHSAVQKGADVFVNRGQGNSRDLLPHAFVDQFRAGMSVQRHDGIIDHPALMGRGQAVLTAEIQEVAITYH